MAALRFIMQPKPRREAQPNMLMSPINNDEGGGGGGGGVVGISCGSRGGGGRIRGSRGGGSFGVIGGGKQQLQWQPQQLPPCDVTKL